MRQVEEAYTHLHDLDWLQEPELARLPKARERTDARQTMPQAQAFRRMLVEAARRAISDVEDVPDKAGVRIFLERYLEGDSDGDSKRAGSDQGVGLVEGLSKGGLRPGKYAVHQNGIS